VEASNFVNFKPINAARQERAAADRGEVSDGRRSSNQQDLMQEVRAHGLRRFRELG
jgi:hypothetical protein